MPAIQLTRLRLQAAQLAENFSQPVVFVRSLHDLLAFYADHTQRPGQSGAPRPLIQPYNVPKPVLRQVEGELAVPAAAFPQSAAALADALWSEPYLEFRLLAITLLGMLPATPPELVLGRVQAWTSQGCEDRLLAALVLHGQGRVRQQQATSYLQTVQLWLTADNPAWVQLGLMSLPPLVSDANFENLPAIFHLLTPFVRATSLGQRPYLLDVLQALAQRSPRETAHYLRHNLDMPGKPGAAWLIRQIISCFPSDIQTSLREELRGQPPENSKGKNHASL